MITLKIEMEIISDSGEKEKFIKHIDIRELEDECIVSVKDKMIDVARWIYENYKNNLLKTLDRRIP